MEEVAETGLELEQGENRALIIEMAETRHKGLGLKPWILAAVSVLALVLAAVLWKGSESSPAQMNSPFIERLIAQQPALKERLGSINITEDRLMMESAGLSKNLTRLLLKDSLSLQHRKLSEKSVQESVATLREVLDASDTNFMTVGEMTKEDPALKTTTCIFHVLQAALYLAEAGSAINSAAVNCPEGEKHNDDIAIIGRRRGEKASHVCAVEISAVLASFGWAAYFLSSAAGTCGVRNLLADCAAQAIGLPTSFANIIESSIAIVEDCDNQDMKQMAISLKAKKKAKVQGDDGDQATAYCALDPIQASYWLARAGLSIQNAVVDCAKKKGEDCAADILFVIMSFGWAGGFLSMAVSDCADVINLKALCSSDIIDLIAGISMAAGEAVEVDLSCVKTNPWPKKNGWTKNNLWTQTQ